MYKRIHLCLCIGIFVLLLECARWLCSACSPLSWRWSLFNLLTTDSHSICVYLTCRLHKHAHKDTHTTLTCMDWTNTSTFPKKYFIRNIKDDVSPQGLVFAHIYNPPFGLKVLSDLRCCCFMNWKCLFVWFLRGKKPLYGRLWCRGGLCELCVGVCEHVWRM